MMMMMMMMIMGALAAVAQSATRQRAFDSLIASVRDKKRGAHLATDALAHQTLGPIMHEWRLTMENRTLQGGRRVQLITIGSSGVVSIADVVLRGGKARAGGAIAVSGGGRLELARCQLVDNSASMSGGAIFVSSSATTVLLSHVTFSGNHAATEDGGAIFVTRRSTVICEQGCNFSGNVAARDGGSVALDEGATISLGRKSNFIGNSAENGGAASARNGSIFSASGIHLGSNHASRSNVEKGDAGGGGALLVVDSEATLTDATISENTANTWRGGSVACFSSKLETRRAVISNDASQKSRCSLALISSTWVDDDVSDVSLANVWLCSESAVLNNTHTGKLMAMVPTFAPTTLAHTYSTTMAPTLAPTTMAPTLAPTTMAPTYSTMSPSTMSTDDTPTSPPCIRSMDELLAEIMYSSDKVLEICSDVDVTETIQVRAGSRLALFAKYKYALDGKGHVQIAHVYDATLALTGLTVRGGFSEGDGGGLVIVGSEARLEAQNCVFFGNKASTGGFASASGAVIVLKGCVLESNAASYVGGAIALFDNSVLSVHRVNFTKNVAETDGGAIFVKRAGVAMEETVFSRNDARGDGGGLSAESAETSVACYSCNFEKNGAGGDGGGLTVKNGVSATLFQVHMYNNKAGINGSAAAILNGSFLFTIGARVEKNEAKMFGAVYLAQAAAWTASGATTLTANSGGGLAIASKSSVYAASELTFAENRPFQCRLQQYAGRVSGTFSPEDACHLREDRMLTQASPARRRLLRQTSRVEPLVIRTNVELVESMLQPREQKYATLVADVSLTSSLNVSEGSKYSLRGSRFNRFIDGGDGIRHFDVVGGALTLESLWLVKGDGILISEGGTLSMTKCRLINSAPIYVSGASLTAVATEFFGGRGGALHASDQASVALTSSTIVDNEGGGIIVTDKSRLDLTDCTLRNNSADHGGAVSLLRESSLTASRSRFVGNKAIFPEPRFAWIELFAAKGGALHISEESSAFLFRCEFQSNTADSGGAIFAEHGATLVSDSNTFKINTARSGRAVHLDYSASWTDITSTIQDRRDDSRPLVTLGYDVKLVSTRTTFHTNNLAITHFWALDSSSQAIIKTQQHLRIRGRGAPGISVATRRLPRVDNAQRRRRSFPSGNIEMGL